jgi:hypothetical protein
MLTDVTILNQKEDYEFLDGGGQRKGIRTFFRVGDDGPFSIFVADKDFTGAKNLILIEQKADEIRSSRAHPDIKR